MQFGCKHALSFKKMEKWSWSCFRDHQGYHSHHRPSVPKPRWARLLPPRFQRWDQLPNRAKWVGLPLQSHGGDSATQWAWRAEHQSKKDYSQALRSNGICLMRFRTFLGPVTPFPLLISPFWNGNICPMLVFLYFGSTWLVWFHRFTAGEEFCLSSSHIPKSHLYLIRWSLEETLDFI